VGNDSESDNQLYLEKTIEEVISFLSGEKENMLDTIWAKLNRSVQSRNFEKAAELRDIVSQVEKIVSSQQFLAAAVEGNHALICLPSSQTGAVELLCIYRGRLGRQVRLSLELAPAEAADLLDSAWQALAEEEARLAATQPGWGKHGGRVIGQEAVDEINIISKWLFAHNGHPAIIPIPTGPPEPGFWHGVAREIPTRLEISSLD
jgi:excinuclease UvrABC nuclease subunit